MSHYTTLIEPLEDRCLMSAPPVWSTTTSDGIWDYAGASEFGNITVGDQWGDFDTVLTGQSFNQCASAPIVWDSNWDDGMDSGNIPFMYKYTSSGGIGTSSLTAAGQTVTDETQATGVGDVDLEAGVWAPGMAVSFNNVDVQFYSNGQLVQDDHIGDISIDRLNSEDPNPASTSTHLTPNLSVPADTVIITGTFRMQTNPGVYPGPTDLFATIYISAQST